MIKIYGAYQPPGVVDELKIGGRCPVCSEQSKYSLTSPPNLPALQADQVSELVAGYTCNACLSAIPIIWQVVDWSSVNPPVTNPVLALRSVEEYEFAHVPESVSACVRESLDCLSVGAYNGFAAMCRRTVQEICTDLGATDTTKVKAQIDEMFEITGLGEEWTDLAYQVMLTGHDGAHPHLPEVNEDRADLLLSLLRDLTYQLYTRPGNIKQAGLLRQEAINS